jgi:hypothetical protein
MKVAIKDGTLVQGDGQKTRGEYDPADPPKLFLVEKGKRRVIHDRAALLDLGIDTSRMQVVDDAELEQIPLSAEPMLAAVEQITLDLYSFLGAGHYMQTWGVLRRTDWGGRIDATTRTWTVTWFGGFRAGVNILYTDAQSFPVGMSATQSYGVDGRWVGRSDRTDYWSTDLTQDQASRTTRITIFHFWNPWTLQDQLTKLVATMKPLAEIVNTITGIGGQAKSS